MDTKLSPLLHTHAVRSEVDTELVLQGVQSAVWVPIAE